MSRRPTRSTLSDTLLPYTTLCRSKKTFSVHVFRRLETRCLQYSGGNINIGYHLLHPGAWFYDRWGVSQHGYFHRFLISRPFVNQSMFSELKTVVTHVNNKRVFQQPALTEITDDLTHRLIYRQ